MALRSELGDFSSIVCFKALITGVEDTLGTEGAAAVFVQAGRLRGQKLANDLGLTGTKVPVDQLAAALNQAVGKEGTRLCRIDAARELPGGVIQVDTAETVCSAGEAMGSQRQCTFTLGAVAAAVEAVMGRPYTARHTGSVLRGGTHDTFELTPVG